MITIYHGFIGDVGDEQGKLVVNTPNDYISARLAIRDACVEKTPLKIYITDPIVERWFWDLREQQGIELINLDPCVRLREKLNVPMLPDAITRELIVELDLLTLPNPEHSIRNVIVWVAKHKLGKIWEEEDPSYSHCSSVITWLVELEDKPTSDNLQSIIDQRLYDWEEKSTGQLNLLYESLRISLATTLQFVCAWKTLSNYDGGIRQQWLEEMGLLIKNLVQGASNLDDLPVPRHVDREISQFIIPHWQRRFDTRFGEIINAGG